VRLWGRRRREPAAGAPSWLVVGLGNPGRRYEGSRHNLGRDAVEALGERHGIALSETRFNARYGLGRLGTARVALALPLTYMNLSGQAVAPLARFYQVPPGAVLVVYDDLDLPLGTLRLRSSGGSGGHNGLASVCASLGTQEVPRLRLGIGRPPPGWEAEDYVLARFTEAERPEAAAVVERAVEAIEAVAAEGLAAAMNRVHQGRGDAAGPGGDRGPRSRGGSPGPAERAADG
jgi:PTH1 family peptidyl-tRNA hydrolase